MPNRDPETLSRVLKELDDVASEAARFEEALDGARQFEPLRLLDDRRIAARRRSPGRRREDRGGDGPA